MINEKKEERKKKKKEWVEEDTIYTKTNMKIIDRNHSKKSFIRWVSEIRLSTTV